MNPYAIEVLPQAAGELTALDRTVARRISRRPQWLGEHFTEIRPETLTGELKGLFKLRVGGYRVVYSAQ